MNSTFTPKQNELIDVIKVYPYETVVEKFPDIYNYYKVIDNQNRKIWAARRNETNKN